MMWEAAFDRTGGAVKEQSAALVKLLSDMQDRVIFPDLFFNWNGKWTKMFCHRTVQGGLWMPVLAAKMERI